MFSGVLIQCKKKLRMHCRHHFTCLLLVTMLQAKRREKTTDVWCPPLWRIVEWCAAAWADQTRLESDLFGSSIFEVISVTSMGLLSYSY